MILEEKVQAVLIAAAGVTALVSASAIKAGFVGQSLGKTFISHYSALGSTETRTHQGRGTLQLWQSYQVDCVAPTYSAARAIATAVLAAIKDYRSGMITTSANVGPYIFDPDLQLHKFPVICDFAENL